MNTAPVPLRTKTAFGIGQIAEGVKAASFNYFLLFYYTQVLGLPGTWTGLALFIATSFDAVTDPLTGSLSDRLRHRWGRRHPFMYASALPMAVFFALLFAPPEGLGPESLFLWLLCFTLLVRGAMTLYHVPHLALGAESGFKTRLNTRSRGSESLLIPSQTLSRPRQFLKTHSVTRVSPLED